jgi:hypothetical protein
LKARFVELAQRLRPLEAKRVNVMREVACESRNS